MNRRSDGKPCEPLLQNPDYSREFCPSCLDTDYEITTAGGGHNDVRCSCGWNGCQCELLDPLTKAARRGFESVQHKD